ncbi:MAG: hypothetical protein ACRD0G_03795 [Acidimicrobiales bacterium]
MRRLLALLTVAALSLLACGGGDDPALDVGADPDEPVQDDGGGIPVDRGIGGPEPRLAEPTPGLDGVHPTALVDYRLVDDATLEVRFYSGVPECNGVESATAAETAEAVTVSVEVGSRIPSDTACIEIAELWAVRLPLDESLGERPVIDTSTGTEVPQA